LLWSLDDSGRDALHFNSKAKSVKVESGIGFEEKIFTGVDRAGGHQLGEK